jgi:hypothetical protein
MTPARAKRLPDPWHPRSAAPRPGLIVTANGLLYGDRLVAVFGTVGRVGLTFRPTEAVRAGRRLAQSRLEPMMPGRRFGDLERQFG